MVVAIKGIVRRFHQFCWWVELPALGQWWEIWVASSTRPDLDSEVFLYVWEHYCESQTSWMRFGFVSLADRRLFEIFQGVTGIGPKMAFHLISQRSSWQWREIFEHGDLDSLRQIPKVGPKLADILWSMVRSKVLKDPLWHSFLSELGPGSLDSRVLKKQDQLREALKGLGLSSHSIFDLVKSCPYGDDNLPEALAWCLRRYQEGKNS